jgi:hypothetical protein
VKVLPFTTVDRRSDAPDELPIVATLTRRD